MKYYRKNQENRDYMFAIKLTGVGNTTVFAKRDESYLSKMFLKQSTPDTCIPIPGYKSVKIKEILEIEFMPGYDFDYIPDNFCRNYTYLHSVKNWPSTPTYLGSNFLSDCSRFTGELDLRNMNKLKTIGYYFLKTDNTKTIATSLYLPDSVESIESNFSIGGADSQLYITPKNLKTIKNEFCKNDSISIDLDFSNTKLESTGNFFIYLFIFEKY